MANIFVYGGVGIAAGVLPTNFVLIAKLGFKLGLKPSLKLGLKPKSN